MINLNITPPDYRSGINEEYKNLCLRQLDIIEEMRQSGDPENCSKKDTCQWYFGKTCFHCEDYNLFQLKEKE